MIESCCTQTGLWMLPTLQEISSVTMHCAISLTRTRELSPAMAADSIISSVRQWSEKQDDDLTILICDYISKRKARWKVSPLFQALELQNRCTKGSPWRKLKGL